MMPIESETTTAVTATLTTTLQTLTTQATLPGGAPQTNCDGVGTFSCQTGTCYTGLDGFIGCCSVSSCAARTTCYSYDAASPTSCNPDTGGCLSCQQTYPYCVTLTNVLENQYIIYCSTSATTITLSYANLITTGSTARTTPASASPPSSPPSPPPRQPPPHKPPPPSPPPRPLPSPGALTGTILGPLLLVLALVLLLLLFRLHILPRRRLALAGGLSSTPDKHPRGTLGGAMLPGGRWGSLKHATRAADPTTPPRESLAPWSPSSLNPRPAVAELGEEDVAEGERAGMATRRYGVEAGGWGWGGRAGGGDG
ncbi:MAG: hypothetical protein FRX48_03662 [Lasallia pustulata]|uniref:Uncharacterized protein n=1 Tax=Lasallia pustulata TaxID=136370 RepID=A0A5M8PSW3_9LECA|nr:MAG: hypothetical protein FRX48_03662 [Lasallia pustulata]